MGLYYKNLDGNTRAFMVQEIQHDVESSMIYLSDNLSPSGQERFPELLLNAARSGTDDSLASDIRPLLNSHEKPRRLKSGGYSKAPVMRSNAHTMLAEGEFNRYYIRALCLRAIDSGSGVVEVYRAKDVTNARSASEQMIGQKLNAQSLLQDLRSSKGVDTALGLPPGPNSGLSAFI